jgi:hypothetical protein
MKKLFLIIIAVTFTSGLSFSQVISNNSFEEFYKQYKMNEYRQNFGMKSDVAGTPYETEEFENGEIITSNNIRYTGIPLRFNIYSNEMEFRTEDDRILCIGAPEFIDSVVVGKEKYVYSPYMLGSKMMRGYFKVLSEGRVILLLRKNVILKPAEPAGAYKEAVPATFVKNPDEFYLRILPAEAKKIAGKKDLQEVLANYPSAMDDFFKKNKIRFSKSEDMIKLVQYYNSLVK